MYKKYTSIEWDYIRANHETKSCMEMALELNEKYNSNIDRNYIAKYLFRHKLTRFPESKGSLRKSGSRCKLLPYIEELKMLSDHLTIIELVSHYDVTYCTVRNFMKVHKIKCKKREYEYRPIKKNNLPKVESDYYSRTPTIFVY